MKIKTSWILGVIFVLAITIRFYAFKESIYFGFDQARDAYISQDIFLKHNLKFIGPPTSGDVGMFHGPLFWYIVGPIYLLFHGDPATVSGVFRIINALGIFLVFGISSSLFSPMVGCISALLYAFSFEESQYSFYVGNPTLGVLSVMAIFFGAILIHKRSKFANWAPLLMFGGAALSTQMNLMFVYTFFIVAALLFILRKQVSNIAKRFWVIGMAVTGLLLSTFVLVELKYQFRSLKLAYKLMTDGYGVMDSHSSKYLLFWDKYLKMYHDNVLGINNHFILAVVAFLVSVFVVYKALKNKAYQILAIWLFGWVFLMILGGHTAYYTNAGLGVAVLVSVAVLIEKLYRRNIWLTGAVCGLILFGNLSLIRYQSPNSLLQDIVTQSSMKLSDEYKMIDTMYMTANGNGFTVRMTGVPYLVQTVWSYLFNHYGLNKYGYLPFWETGNVLGFPGEMPTPRNGSTCLRFLGREPTHGLPQVLVDHDLKLENDFSSASGKIKIGEFTLETRHSIDIDCHNNRP